MNPTPYTRADFDFSPLMFYYEVTLACDLVCKHCRASAQAEPHPEELDGQQSKALLSQAATFPRPPNVVLTGGDPLKRPDLFALIEHACSLGLAVALTPSATPLATREAFARAKQAGISALGISLDGADAETHDAFRGWQGSFQRTLEMLDNARQLQLPVQVNTTITARNLHQIDAIAELLSEKEVFMWSVFFLVPVGRGLQEARISPQQYEEAFARLWHHARTKPYSVKTTEAPHYRRFVLQQGGDPLAGPAHIDRESERLQSAHTGCDAASGAAARASGEATRASEGVARGSGAAAHEIEPPAPGVGAGGGVRATHRAPLGVGDGKGIMFVSHTGEIYPAGFLPLRCGKFPVDSVVDVYQNHPTFRALRDPDRFKGKCGVCEYRHVCGGSRARAYALTGDPLETDPDCAYVPAAWRARTSSAAEPPLD